MKKRGLPVPELDVIDDNFAECKGKKHKMKNKNNTSNSLLKENVRLSETICFYLGKRRQSVLSAEKEDLKTSFQDSFDFSYKFFRY